VPIVAIIAGVRIEFYPSDHAPPHFHARINEYKATIDIQSCKLTKGQLPKNKVSDILLWTTTNQTALQQAWDDMRAGRLPSKIQG
jgi:Domain of unknown function (DUF4160)